MKRTALTSAQQRVLEELIATRGMVVTTQDVLDLLHFETPASKYRFVSHLAAAGWLVRIKQGLYQIADVGTLGMLTLSRFAVAHLLLPESYVSFLAALQFHGLFDQSLSTVSSVALHQRQAVALEGVTYLYVKTISTRYTGFSTHRLDGQQVQIADGEKAIVDLLLFRRTNATVDLVLEILRDSRHRLDLQLLETYALSTTATVQRSLGFLLDGVGADPGKLRSAVAGSSSVSQLTPDGHRYSAAWRLYYGDYVAQELAYSQ